VSDRYEIDLTRAARRALAESLELDVAMAVSALLLGRSRTTLAASARSSTQHWLACTAPASREKWRVVYRIDDEHARVLVQAISHRRDAYRTP
jgi:hypothetical protein